MVLKTRLILNFDYVYEQVELDIDIQIYEYTTRKVKYNITNNQISPQFIAKYNSADI